MGSFLVTCALTKQTIREDEEVYVIPIAKTNGYSPLTLKDGTKFLTHERPCYNTDLYQPFGVMFTAEYADYGRYDINWSKENNREMLKFYLEQLKKKHLPVVQGENECHDMPVDLSTLAEDAKPEEIWEYIHKAIWQTRLLINTSYFGNEIKPTPIEYCIVHKQHADTLIQMYKSKLRDPKWLPESYKDTCKLSPEELYNKYLAVDKDRLAQLRSELKTAEGEAYQQLLTELVNMDPDFSSMTSSRNMLFLNDSGGSAYNAFILRYDLRAFLNERSNTESVVELFTAFNTLYLLYLACDKINTYLAPVYLGNQDYSNENGFTYSAFMQKVLETEKANVLANPWGEYETAEEVEEAVKALVEGYDYWSEK